ncbi:pyridoxamine 5'-phosphate oxidase [Blattabacterium cuenoti]|uniref:pyridoxamine 5'-phosphate oxidase n=1 Tax=Blattabacterium cuenoti TaxID=1653831 RepID=UPI00163C5E5E|nr:pyridoxamine 5'-phosphate oxidase [Blattabacterium cuenoti]
MNLDLSDYRKNYKKKHVLLEDKVPEDPFELFHKWFEQEKKFCNDNDEINAMSISTIGEDGVPETRIVLLKEYSKNGFIFYTNYYSSKGRSIKRFPKTCISFYWKNTERQIIIKGNASKVKKEKSDKYFKKRPKGHQIGSWISKQSSIISSRENLLNQYNEWNEFFKNNSVKRPFSWGGYIIKPYRMEFWEGQENRLHDRLVYYTTTYDVVTTNNHQTLEKKRLVVEEENEWKIYRLYP